MIHQDTIRFLKALKKNNQREWFELNREKYVFAKEDFFQFATASLGKMIQIDPTLSELVPKQCVFRINRDVRFSKNKEPYKTNFGASFSKGGKKIQTAGYYFHLEPGACFIAGGFWMPMAPELGKIRQEIDYSFDAFNKIIKNKSFRTSFKELVSTSKLVRPPKGYAIDNPAIEFLKLKNFIVSIPIEDQKVLQPNFVNYLVSEFKKMQPFIHFINSAIDQ